MMIKVELGQNGNLKFTSLDEIKAWLQEERQAWNWLDGRLGRLRNDSVGQIFRKGWTTLLSSIDSGDEKAIEQNLVDLFGDDGKLILSNSSAGTFLTRLSENDPTVANAASFYFVLDEIPKQYKREPVFQMAHIAWIAFIEGVSGAKTDLASIRQKGKRVVSLLQNQSGDFDKSQKSFSEKSTVLLEGLRKEYDSLTEGFGEEHSSFLGAARKEYDDLKAFYETELAFKAPVDYWAKVAKRHRIWATIWGSLFGLTLIGLGVVILKFANDIRDFLTAVQRETIAITLTVALGTVVFWTLRLVAKIFFSNYQRAVDAAERETMVKTFLALRREGHIADEQLDLVLAPLFRPGATGLVRDDSAPEYGIMAKLSKELGKK